MLQIAISQHLQNKNKEWAMGSAVITVSLAVLWFISRWVFSTYVLAKWFPVYLVMALISICIMWNGIAFMPAFFAQYSVFDSLLMSIIYYSIGYFAMSHITVH